jgi:hypothetical protein
MQQNNAEMVENLSTHFPRRMDASYAWARAISGFQFTPSLRALYPCSSIDERGSIIDLSGQGRVLTPGTAPNYSSYGLIPYVDFVRASSMYLQRPSEPGLEITTGLTIWSWVRFDVPSTGADTYFFSKWYTVGNKRSYLLYKTAANAFTFDISTDGTAIKTIGDAAANYLTSKWWFIAGRFYPSTELALFVGQAISGAYTWYRNVAVIPATIFVSPEALEMGRGNRTNYLDGQMTLSGIAAAALADTQIWNMFSQTRPLLV